jgi:protease IV
MKSVFSFLGRVIDTLRLWLGRLFFLLLVGIVLYLMFSGPSSVRVPEQSALVLAPAGVVAEQRATYTTADMLLGPVTRSSVLEDLLSALDRAASDERISALVLDVSDLQGISPAVLETLSDALLAFRESGKPIYAYGEYFSQAQYALVSHADNITLHPMGSLMITGYGGSQLFFRDLLERLRVNVHIFRVGEYKSMSEPFTRMDMSAEARADTQALLDALWERYLGRVSANRGLAPEVLQAYADEYAELLTAAGGDMARVAFEQGLIDNIAGRDSFRRQVAALVGVANGSFRQIHYRDYVNATRAALPVSGDQVGVIVAQGAILPGNQPRGFIGADDLSGLIAQAQVDPAVKALVLRVDSPGGSPTASEEIRAALVQVQRAGKPVVVSMGGMAASGGYWISASADEIWASPATVTGSIGVVGVVPTFENALDGIGVGVDGVGTTVLSRGGDPLSGLNETMETVLQSSVDNTYARFLQLVADGRNMSTEEVDVIARGRIWTGEQALAIGLVDGLGDIEQAVAVAASLADISQWQTVYISRPLSFGEQLLTQMMESIGGAQIMLQMQSGVSTLLGLDGIRNLLPGISSADLLRWQSLTKLIWPQNQSSERMQMLMLCERCLVTP